MAIPISDMHKQSIEKQRMQILANITLLAHRATLDVGFIPYFQWIQFQQEIDDLYKQLSDTVNHAGANYNAQTNVR
ncbi:MAG: hypothetical protein NC311_00575 [Muribaculaceae bacterium]|nr:hypothetical protein [Muribaculaceae bacterium]